MDYIPKSRLLDAGFPPGATTTWIERARAWRRKDARDGSPGSARRQRIRLRKRARDAFVYVEQPKAAHKHKSGDGYRPDHHKGYAA